MQTQLTEKQEMLLLGLTGEPRSTFDLFDGLWAIAEDAKADPSFDLNIRGWDRGGIRASMVRLEDRGLVDRVYDKGFDRPTSGRHGFYSTDDEALHFTIKGHRPRYKWRLTKAGEKVLHAAGYDEADWT